MINLEFELCTRCGKCLSACPTYYVFLSEPYSPRARIFFLKNNLNHPSLEECTWCEKCEKACPHNLSYPFLYFQNILKKQKKRKNFAFLPKTPFLFSKNKLSKNVLFSDDSEKEPDVFIFLSCDVKFFYPKVLEKILEFLKKQNKKVKFIDADCCGIHYLIFKNFEALRLQAEKIIKIWEKTKKEVIVFCATCYWMFKKVYPFVLKGLDTAQEFSKKIKTIFSYTGVDVKELKFYTEKVLFHLPCHLTEEKNYFSNIKTSEFCCGSPRVSLIKKGFQEKYQKFWKKNLEDKNYLATFCIGCYLNFKWILRIKEPPKIVHWLELLC